MNNELIVQKSPNSPFSEIFRTLRTNIQFMNTTKKLQTILVTSTFPGEGKSYVSSNLAVTFAQAGKKVILIDADMRKGRLYSIFEVENRPGLSNYLSGIDLEYEEKRDITKCIQTTEIKNLLLMPAGNVPPNPSELLISPQMNELLEELKEVCDIIIIDGTPCELVTDSIVLSRIVDSTVVVTAANQTKKDNLGRIIANIQKVGGKLAGVVINKVPISAKKYSGKYYNYSYTASKNVKNEKQFTNKYNKSQTKSKQKERNVKNKTENRRKVNTEIDRQDEFAKLAEKFNNDILESPETLKHQKVELSEETANNIVEQMNAYLEKEKNNLEGQNKKE